MNLEVDFAGLKLKNPVTVASGTFGYGREFQDFIDLNRLGAIITKGTSLKPRPGNKAPRICETASGMLNSIGLQNPGVEYFAEVDLPFLRKFDTKIIVNACGSTIEEYVELCKILNTLDIDGVELNLSCPNVKAGCLAFGTTYEGVKNVTSQVRKVLDENGGKDIKIVTKVENVEGLEHMVEIVDNADVQMIARGDMATETDFTEPPVVQKKFIKLSNKANKPVITATQMLESMTFNPLPTRAEASDVANAIYDRTSAVMLSGECAMGKYPVECVKTMVKIANRVEPEIDYWKRFRNNDNYELDNLEMKIAYSSCVMAMNMEADAIVCYTHTGDSARRIAGLGAGCPILAITDNRRTFNQLAIAWNVTPIYVEKKDSIDEVVEAGIEKLKSKGILEKGDMVVVAGGAKWLASAEDSKIIGGIAKI